MHATDALTYADFMQAKLLRNSFCRMFCSFSKDVGKYSCGAEAGKQPIVETETEDKGSSLWI